MAAYAAVVSLMHIIDKIESHPSPPISLDKQQVESLTDKVNSLREFLELYTSPFGNSDEADPLEMRIADAAHAVEDVIESYIVDNIHLSAATATRAHDDGDEEISCINFYKCLQNAIEDVDLIVKEVAEIVPEKAGFQPQMQRDVFSHGGRKSMMVGFDDELLQLLDKLTGGHNHRQIIPIVGMGGIGKTTLARNVFRNSVVKQHFDVCLWATISQDYDPIKTLSDILSQTTVDPSEKSEEELELDLHKYLWGRRYLVIMDDMWSIRVWEKIGRFIPECNNESRILVTTRLSNVASYLTSSNSLGMKFSLDMKFLDELSSWELFSKTVFGEEISFPHELEKIGKKIVKNCNGLPLSIVVIGGLMAKTQPAQEYWEHIGKNLNSIVNSENDEYCLKILKMSYDHLPTHLKPSFLYMGVFEEDRAIRVSTLVKLWDSEGFLKPIKNKSSETIAKEYLQELVDRNLIQVHELGAIGNMKHCKVHDLLRDLSLKEAQKQRFYYLLKEHTHTPWGINNQHRLVIPNSEEEVQFFLESLPRARSYVCHNPDALELPDFRLLRTLHMYEKGMRDFSEHFLENVFRLANSRYLAVGAHRESQVPPSIHLLWNLHKLIIYCMDTKPIEIWKMHQLKHVEFTCKRLRLPDPPSGKSDIVILEKLQALEGVNDLNLNEEMVKRIPNLKKLAVTYEQYLTERVNCLSYLQHLSKLETFYCETRNGCGEYLQKISFPNSLKKKLSLNGLFYFDIEFQDILPKIGSLPLLQKLKLSSGSFRTRTWETVEGQFPSLKFLGLYACHNLVSWTVSESSHFPLLEELRLHSIAGLKEIPPEIGEIPTLKSIVMIGCNKSLVMSAKMILEEQEELQGEDLDLYVEVRCSNYDMELQEIQNLASPNFHVRL